MAGYNPQTSHGILQQSGISILGESGVKPALHTRSL